MDFGASPALLVAVAFAWGLAFQAIGSGLWHIFWHKAAVSGRYQRPLNHLLVLFYQQVLGIGASMLILQALAVLGLFHTVGLIVAFALVLLPLTLLLSGLRLGFRPGARARMTSLMRWWEWGVLACAVLLSVMVSWRFPGAWDDTSYHLPLARTIVEHHALVANEWLRFPYFPAFMHLLFAAGLLVDVWLAQWLATWPVVVILVGLMGASRWLCRHAAWGVLAWTLVVSTPALTHSLGFAYVDVGLALFCMAAVVAVALWAQSKTLKSCAWLVMAGGCAGIAVGIKVHGLVVAAGIGCAVLGAAVWTGQVERVPKLWASFGLPCVALGGFWYARSYWVTGDPVHPVGASVFGYYLWTAGDMAIQVAEQATHGVPKQWGQVLLGIWRAHVPYLYAAFCIPLLVTSGYARAWAVVGCVVWVNTLFWFWVSQVDRYLVPVLPLAALLCMGVALCVARGASVVVGVSVLEKTLRRYGGVLALVCGIWLAWSAITAWLQRPPINIQSQAYDEIPLLRRAQELAPKYGNRVLNLGYENAFFYYNGQLVGDWFGRAAFWRIADCRQKCHMRSPDETQRVMQELEVRMVLINARKFPFDEARYSSDFVFLARNGDGFLYGLKPIR